MKKPSLSDFQVSETDLAEAKRTRSLLVILAIAWSAIGMGVAIYLGEQGRLLFVLALPPYSPIIFYFLAKATVRFASPTFRRALDYEAAVEQYNQWWIRTQADFWRGLSGRAFEIELANLYRRLGLDARITTASDDKGVDFWIVRNGHRVPVQCKAHRRPLGPGAARELYGTMQHFGISTGILASVSGFTSGTAEFVRGKGIELVDLSSILQMQKHLE